MKRKLLHQFEKFKWLCHKPLAAILISFAICSNADASAGTLTNVYAEHRIEVTITGSVLDELRRPVPGVNVNIAGTTVGAVTDNQGRYQLILPDAYTNRSLTFSYIGYLKQEVAIAGRNVININLIPDTKSLTEVVVVGYGTQSRVSLTGAVNQVSAKNMENKPVLNTLQALQGESPNLIIQQSQLNPGSNININIRGVGTLGNNDPLVVIDGIIGGNMNLHLLRYAEVLLTYAEAKQAMGQMDAAVWDNTIRLLRQRAGFTDPQALDFPGNAGLTQIIRRERRTELAMEGLRTDDIRRWNIAETVLNGFAHGARFGDAAVDNGYIRAQKRIFTSKDYLWPIPSSEIGLNANLTQNPGY